MVGSSSPLTRLTLEDSILRPLHEFDLQHTQSIICAHSVTASHKTADEEAMTGWPPP